MYGYNAPAPARYKGTDINAATVQNLLRTINSMSKRTKRQSATDDTLSKIRSIIGLYRPHLINRNSASVPELVIEALAAPNANQVTHNFNYKYDYNTGATTATPAGVSYDNFGQPVPPPPPPPNAAPGAPSPGFGVGRASIDRADLDELNTAIDATCKTTDTPDIRALVSTLIKMSDKYFSDNALSDALKRLYCVDRRLNEAQRAANDMDSLLQCINKSTNRNYPDLSQICDILTNLYETCKSLYARFFKINSELEFDTLNLEQAATRIIERVDRLIEFERAYRSLVQASSEANNTLVEFPDRRLIDTNLRAFNDQFRRFMTTRTVAVSSRNNGLEHEAKLAEIAERHRVDTRLLRERADRLDRVAEERDALRNDLQQVRSEMETLRERARNDRDAFDQRLAEAANAQSVKNDKDKIMELYTTVKRQYDQNMNEQEDTVNAFQAQIVSLTRQVAALTAECNRDNAESDEINLLRQSVSSLRETVANDQINISTLNNELEQYRNNFLERIINDQVLGYNKEIEQINTLRAGFDQQKNEIQRLMNNLQQQLDENRMLQEARARLRASEAGLQEQHNELQTEIRRLNEQIDRMRQDEQGNGREVASYTGRNRARPYNTRQRGRIRDVAIPMPAQPPVTRVEVPWDSIESVDIQEANMQVVPAESLYPGNELITTAPSANIDHPFGRYVAESYILQDTLSNYLKIRWVVYHVLSDIRGNRPSIGYAQLVRRLGLESFVQYVNLMYPQFRITLNNLDEIRADFSVIQSQQPNDIDEDTLVSQEVERVMQYARNDQTTSGDAIMQQ